MIVCCAGELLFTQESIDIVGPWSSFSPGKNG
jgi:hypothetical protein